MRSLGKKKTVWLLLLLLALLLRMVLPAAVVEQWYSRGLFPGIRVVQGFISGLSPVPLVYLLLAGMLGFAVWNRKRFLAILINGLFILGFAFLLLWGFNYQRVPFASQAGLDARPLDPDQVEAEFEWATRLMLESRQMLDISPDFPVADFYPAAVLEDMLYPSVKAVVKGWGYPAAGNMRVRLVYPKGLLLQFSSSGVYLPWTGEGHLDAGLHPLNWPFVMAHEMAHGYGMADEGVCNFLAYQVCTAHPDPYIRYAGTLYYWRYAAYEMKRFCPAELEDALRALPEGVRSDLKAIREYSDRYPDLIPMWRDLVYDSFLKSQGLRQGILSYDQVLILAHAYRMQGDR